MSTKERWSLTKSLTIIFNLLYLKFQTNLLTNLEFQSNNSESHWGSKNSRVNNVKPRHLIMNEIFMSTDLCILSLTTSMKEMNRTEHKLKSVIVKKRKLWTVYSIISEWVSGGSEMKLSKIKSNQNIKWAVFSRTFAVSSWLFKYQSV